MFFFCYVCVLLDFIEDLKFGLAFGVIHIGLAIESSVKLEKKQKQVSVVSAKD